MAGRRDNARSRTLASFRDGLGDALSRALALFSILLNFTLPFGVALAGPTDENGTALCLSGYGATADTLPFAPEGGDYGGDYGGGDGGGLATDGDCLLCITCHASSMGASDPPPQMHHVPIETRVSIAMTAVDIQTPRGGEGAMRVRAPPATL